MTREMRGSMVLTTRWPPHPSRKWESRFRAATDYARRGDWNNAIQQFEQALTLNPTGKETLVNIALAYCKTKQYSKALEPARRAVDAWPENATAWSTLAFSLNGTGDREAAMKALEHALANADDPASRSGYLMTLANWYALANDNEAALKLYDRAILDDPTATDAYFNAGALLDQLGETDRAMEYVRKVTELNANDHEAWFDLGHLHKKKGAGGEALRCFERSHALRPDFYKVCLSLALLHEDNADLQRATEYYAKSISLTEDPQLREAIARQITKVAGLPESLVPSLLSAAGDDRQVQGVIDRHTKP